MMIVIMIDDSGIIKEDNDSNYDNDCGVGKNNNSNNNNK